MILSLNLGGTSPAATAYAHATALDQLADVTVIGETKFGSALDASNLAASMAGRLFYRDAPPTVTQSGQRAAQNGGIAIVVHDSSIKVVPLADDARGLIALSLRRPDARPFLLVAVYLPPASSPRKDWRVPVLERAADIIRREAPHHGGHALVGDLNSQIGPFGGRLATASTSTNHHDLVRLILLPHAMMPVAGRATAAPLTSPRIGTDAGPAAEVDYIITRADACAVAIQTVDPPHIASWHRPIGAIIALEPVPTAATSVEPARAHPPRPPPYPAPFWAEHFHNMNAALRNAERAAADGAPTNVLYAMLANMYSLSRPRTARAPVTSVRREYKGAAIPVDAVALLDEARALRKRAHASRDETERATLAALADTKQRAACTMTAEVRKRARETYTDALETARRTDARGLMRSIAAAASGTNNSGAYRPPEAMPAFVAAYKKLHASGDSYPAIWAALYPQLPSTVPRTWASFHWTEIYLALFPYTQHAYDAFVQYGGHTPQCAPTCTQCTAFRDQGAAHMLSPDDIPAPSWLPSLKLNRTPGLDGVTAEMLRHFRSPDGRNDTEDYRERLSKLLARLFDELATSGPPDGLVDVVVTALDKVSKSGERPDPTVPDRTRGISLHNILSKLMDILIDVRFIHVIVTERVINAFQAGFMPNRSAEQCVFTLIETIRARFRTGLDTWVLFIDFWKAYDTVSPSAMWAVLTSMGFPPRIIQYLRCAYESRRTYFSFNGALVDVWEQLLGLCQGGVLSCILFNLFLESLARHLATQGDRVRGVDVTTASGTFNLVHTFFADDAAGVAGDRASFVALAEEVVKWSEAHGVRITVTGVVKTAGIRFTVTRQDALPDPVTIRPSATNRDRDITIPFTRTYVYIGHPLTDTLNIAPMQNTIATKMREGLAAFMANRVLHGCSLALQRSYVMSFVVGAASNLLAMAPPGADLEAKMDNVLLGAVAYVYRTSQEGLRLLGHADLRIPTAAALLLRAYERFRLTALTHPTPAGALLRVIHGDTTAPTNAASQRSSNLRPWTASYYSMLRRFGFNATWTMRLDSHQTRPWEISQLAASLANRAAHMQWTASIEAYLAARAAKAAADPLVAPRAPPPTLFALRASDAAADVAADDIPPGARSRLTLYGPGAGAPICAYTRLKPYYYLAVYRARSGRGALFERPFWVAEPEPKLPRARPPRGATPAARRAFRATAAAAEAARKTAATTAATTRARAIYRDTRCNLCAAPIGDLVHLCTTCPATAARRDAALGAGRLNAHLTNIAVALYAAHGRARVPVSLDAAINALDPSSPEAAFLITHITNSAPWRVTDTLPGWTIAARLGQLLDRAMRRGAVAPIADAWVRAAHAIVTTIGLRWWQLLTPPARAALEAAGHRIPTA